MVRSARLAGIATAAVVLLTVAAPRAAAQDENALKAAFEGRRIILRMDMPGTADGVDLQIDPPRSIDYKKYRDNLRRYGVAVGSGESSTITLIKLKKDLIEFQIGGGGYGTFGDDTDTSSGIKMREKSDREKDLEKRIKDEKDRDRKRALERELDEVRRRRENENRMLEAESERIEEAKKARLAERRLQGGSRFNLRWSPKVPVDLRAEDIEKALVEYVDFRGVSSYEERTPTPTPVALSAVRKGMRRGEAEAMFGSPVERSEKREGSVAVTTLIFEQGEQRLTAAFIEDVLVRYTITSK
jgi:hypothetical protein